MSDRLSLSQSVSQSHSLFARGFVSFVVVQLALWPALRRLDNRAFVSLFRLVPHTQKSRRQSKFVYFGPLELIEAWSDSGHRDNNFKSLSFLSLHSKDTSSCHRLCDPNEHSFFSFCCTWRAHAHEQPTTSSNRIRIQTFFIQEIPEEEEEEEAEVESSDSDANTQSNATTVWFPSADIAAYLFDLIGMIQKDKTIDRSDGNDRCKWSIRRNEKEKSTNAQLSCHREPLHSYAAAANIQFYYFELAQISEQNE